jgi:uncharacterized damage-inducible protein DinB
MSIVLAEALAVLERTPRVLDAQLRDLPDAWTEVTEGEKTWNARNVLGHLIDGEDHDWIPRARKILEGGGPFEPFDRFAHLSRTVPVRQLLDTFAAKRAANLETLKTWNLGPRELARTGTHPEFGAVTLEQLLATWVAHDFDHLGQIARVMARRYVAAVGPWKAYLSILK